jgi:hypothetical protein
LGMLLSNVTTVQQHQRQRKGYTSCQGWPLIAAISRGGTVAGPGCTLVLLTAASSGLW